MVRTVEERRLEVEHRETCERTRRGRFANTLLDRLHVFFGHRAADDFVLEDVARAGRQRLQTNPDVAVLTLTAGLAHEFALYLDRLRDRFFVRDLRFPDVRFHLELAFEAVENDLERLALLTGELADLEFAGARRAFPVLQKYPAPPKL